MRRRLHLWVAVLALGGVATAQGDSGFDYQTAVSGPATVGVGEPFVVDVVVGLNADTLTNTPTTALSLTWNAQIPAGLRVLGGAWHGHPLGTACTSNCRFDIPEGTISQPYDYDLVAGTPGTYTVTATLASTSTTDTDPSNNNSSIQIKVAPLKLHLASGSAAKARAGRRFTWAVKTLSAISGAAVRPARATCSARIGKKALAGKATISSGQIDCAWAIPARTNGRQLTATTRVTLAAATAALTRRFTIAR